MLIRNFEYLAPHSIEEACGFLNEHYGEARALAGGQSLIPLMKLNLVEAKYIVDLKRISGLRGISRINEFLTIGALTTHSEIAESETVRSEVPLLSETASRIGHPQVRNRGTIGGSLSHADPAGDYISTMLVLEAQFVSASERGSRRRIPAKDFFKGAFSTDLRRGEILERIEVPIPSSDMSHSFMKLTLGHGDFPLLVVSVLGRVADERFEEVRIGLGGVAEVPFRSMEAEEFLNGKAVSEANISEAAKIASNQARPEGDLGVSKEYKSRMLDVYIRRALGGISRGL
ncbi:MAG TPA: xanthine dehydrogenase family protein subunit M [Nitrososphaerales archaeon]|nr:xanthine dehydrogenase family protein subunit M [Nitrososphaerales archaeon]